MVALEAGEFTVELAQLRVFRQFGESGVIADRILLSGDGNFQGQLARRAPAAGPADGENVAAVELRHLDEIAHVIVGDGARPRAVTLKVALLQGGAVPALFR